MIHEVDELMSKVVESHEKFRRLIYYQSDRGRNICAFSFGEILGLEKEIRELKQKTGALDYTSPEPDLARKYNHHKSQSKRNPLNSLRKSYHEKKLESLPKETGSVLHVILKNPIRTFNKAGNFTLEGGNLVISDTKDTNNVIHLTFNSRARSYGLTGESLQHWRQEEPIDHPLYSDLCTIMNERGYKWDRKSIREMDYWFEK